MVLLVFQHLPMFAKFQLSGTGRIIPSASPGRVAEIFFTALRDAASRGLDVVLLVDYIGAFALRQVRNQKRSPVMVAIHSSSYLFTDILSHSCSQICMVNHIYSYLFSLSAVVIQSYSLVNHGLVKRFLIVY